MYISTRGNEKVSASKAILDNLKDGGVYIFDKLPKIEFTEEWVHYSYQDMAKIILKAFLDDFSSEEIDYCVNNAYNGKHFNKEMVSFDSTMNFGFLNLHNGQTFGANDMVTAIIPYLVEVSKKKQNENRNTVFLAASISGLGSSTLASAKYFDNYKAVIVYPKDGITRIGVSQIKSLENQNLISYGCDGSYCDCQNIINNLCSNDYRNAHIVRVDSFNICRLISQIIYFTYGYFHLVSNYSIRYTETINVALPIENIEYILSALITKQLGVPINNIICGTNDASHMDFLKNGTLNDNVFNNLVEMANIERLVYLLKNNYKTNETVDNEYIKKNARECYKKIQDTMRPIFIDENGILESIRELYKKYKIAVDSKTAYLYSAFLENSKQTPEYTLIVSTSSPYKFAGELCSALELNVSEDEFENIDTLELYSGKMVDYRILGLKRYYDEIVLNKEELKNKIHNLLLNI